MTKSLWFVLGLFVILPSASYAQDQVASAESAGPSSVSADATIMDWEMNVVREGTNGWVCLPDNANTEGADPWCINEPWMDFLGAYVNKTEPSYSTVGIAYMLVGDSPVSNVDPYATEKTDDNQWVEGLGAHLMVIVPDHSMLEGISTDPWNGGPWIMWPDTPYAHIMIPVESYPKE